MMGLTPGASSTLPSSRESSPFKSPGLFRPATSVSAASSLPVKSAQSLSLPPTTDFQQTMAAVTKLLDDKFLCDKSFPDLANLFSQPSSAVYSSSSLPLLKRSSIVPLPDAIFEQYENLQCKMLMGVFPEIKRVWLTVDNRLFLWNYENPDDFYTYDESDQIIVAVGLARPIKNVFVENIEYVLVIATPVEVTLLGLGLQPVPGTATAAMSALKSSTTDPSSGSRTLGNRKMQLQLYSTQMQVPADNIAMNQIVGMENGRIFMLGMNGHIYEIQYRAEEGWLTSRCRKINRSHGTSWIVPSVVTNLFSGNESYIKLAVDNQRHILYALTSRDSIHVFDLGQDGNGWDGNRVVYSSLQSDYYSKKNQAIQDPLNFKLIDLFPVALSESRAVHLVAVSSNGTRYYFTLNSSRPTGTTAFDHPVQSIRLVHIRDPPPQPQPLDFVAPTNHGNGSISVSFYNNGVFLSASAATEDSDVLECVCQESGRIMGTFQQMSSSRVPTMTYTSGIPSSLNPPDYPAMVPLMEVHMPQIVDSKCWGMYEVSSATSVDAIGSKLAMAAPSIPGITSTELSVHECSAQFNTPQREFLVMTNSGVVLYRKMRPIDMLLMSLQNGAYGGDAAMVGLATSGLPFGGASTMKNPRYQSAGEAWKHIINLFGEEECAAMCIGIACRHPVLLSGDSAKVPDSMVFHATQLFKELPSSPNRTSNAGAAGEFVNSFLQKSLQTSSRLQQQPQQPHTVQLTGLAIYLSRLIRPIWKSLIVKKEKSNGKERMICGIDQRLSSEIRNALDALSQFLNRNMNSVLAFTSRDTLESRDAEPNVAQFNQMLRYDGELLAQMSKLVQQMIEGLGFVKLITEAGVATLIDNLKTKEFRDRLNILTFESLIVQDAGREVAKALISARVQSLMSQSLDISSTTDLLRRQCPSFYSVSDVEFHQAFDYLEKALKYRNDDRGRCLHESVLLFERVAASLDIDTLTDIVNKYCELEQYHVAAGLALLVAKLASPAGEVVDGQGQVDDQKRLAAYQIVLQILDLVHVRAAETKASATKRRSANGIESGKEAAYEEHSRRLMETLLSSQDPDFHAQLYDYLIVNQMTSQLLTIESDKLESYLEERKADPVIGDLLWKWYMSRERFRDASIQQHTMAVSQNLPFNLAKRMEYLSNALATIKSVAYTKDLKMADFESEVEEQLDVARVQMVVMKELNDLSRKDLIPEDARIVHEAIAKLDKALFDMTTLYNDFCAPFHLHEASLHVFKVAGYQDPAMISTAYKQLFMSVAASSPGMECAALESKLQSLARVFYPDVIIFPFRDIIHDLERHSLVKSREGIQFREGWVVDALRNGGVPLSDVFDAYQSIYETKPSPWSDYAKLGNLVKQITYLLETWINTFITNRYDRLDIGFPFKTVQDAIAKYLITIRDEEVSVRLNKVQKSITAIIEGRL